MPRKITNEKLYIWLYEYFAEQPQIEDCPIPKEELLMRLSKRLEEIRKSNAHVKANKDPLREEILNMLQGTTENNPMTSHQIWDKSPVLQTERKVMGVTNLLKKLVADGVVIKIPRPTSQKLVKYYINPDYGNEG